MNKFQRLNMFTTQSNLTVNYNAMKKLGKQIYIKLITLIHFFYILNVLNLVLNSKKVKKNNTMFLVSRN